MIFNYDLSDLVNSIETIENELSAIKFDDVNVVTTSSTDLNNYITNGLYYFSSSYTPTNIPTGTNGWLIVLNDSTASVVKQVWHCLGTVNTDDHNTYVRTLSGGNWSTWKRFYTSGDTIPIANGGTGATTTSGAKTSLGFATFVTTTTSLASGTNSWTKSVSGVTTSNTVICTPDPVSYAQWVDNRVRCSGQGDGTLSFVSDTNTSAAITVNVLILN